MSDDITVLRGGKLIEAGRSEAFFTTPEDPYSQELLALTPAPIVTRAAGRRGTEIF